MCRRINTNAVWRSRSIWGWARVVLIALALCGAGVDRIQGAEDAQEHPAHDEIRAMRDAMIKAYENRDIDALLSYVDEDVTVVFQDAKPLHGPEAIREYYNRMLVGEDRVVENIKLGLTVDRLSTLYGEDTATAFGTLDDEYHLRNGKRFKLHSVWTATLVNKGEGWRVAGFHASTDMFQNAVMDSVIRIAKVGGVAALLMGVVLGLGLPRIWRKFSARSA